MSMTQACTDKCAVSNWDLTVSCVLASTKSHKFGLWPWSPGDPSRLEKTCWAASSHIGAARQSLPCSKRQYPSGLSGSAVKPPAGLTATSDPRHHEKAYLQGEVRTRRQWAPHGQRHQASINGCSEWPDCRTDLSVRRRIFGVRRMPPSAPGRAVGPPVPVSCGAPFACPETRGRHPLQVAGTPPSRLGVPVVSGNACHERP